jgi:hypothetical protein
MVLNSPQFTRALFPADSQLLCQLFIFRIISVLTLTSILTPLFHAHPKSIFPALPDVLVHSRHLFSIGFAFQLYSKPFLQRYDIVHIAWFTSFSANVKIQQARTGKD